MKCFRYFICALGVCLPVWLSAQVMGFENGIPPIVKEAEGSRLATSTLYYKDGKQSLEWKFQPASTLLIETSLSLDEVKQQRYGITLWIYNEEVSNDSLVFQFLDKENQPSYEFAFRLTAKGWRACWIGFQHMKGNKQSNELVKLLVRAPQYEGRVFLDRITLPERNINLRTTPDMQMPYNNSLTFRDLWHWCRVWQWEQYAYDIPLAESLSHEKKSALRLVEDRLDEYARGSLTSHSQIEKAYRMFEAAGIRVSGTGFVGAPIVAPDELNKRAGELSWGDVETMLTGFASDYVLNKQSQALTNYFTLFDYAINQGFAYGSGMGTNHHYGYQVRKIYTTAWLLRNEIYTNSSKQDILTTLAFWAALQETRKPYQYGRDELLDSWHTLLMSKLIAAMLPEDDKEKDRELCGLSCWLSTSLCYTPGTIGGIKVDGTTFHHGGFYPAYTTGALAMIGNFIGLTQNTSYGLTVEARRVFKTALHAIRNYSNLYEWGIGIGGRHPFTGSMKKEDVNAYAHLALVGNLSGGGEEIDLELAGDYLRLEPNRTALGDVFRQKGIEPALAPQGFFVYNYGATGIFRRNNWMVTLRGYNTDVWGAEIYTKDNRYGRYQSYGSVQIFGTSSPETRTTNGYVEEGWDWNRLPGTTSIHLPLDLLDSPNKGTTMAHSKERFSGSTAFEGMHGVFAMKLSEAKLLHFTPDFTARKSVFCFDNRLICLGTGISNTNAGYPTETTLFQSACRSDKEAIRVNRKKIKELLPETVLKQGKNTLWDGYGNYYHIVKGNVHLQVAEQSSRHNKTREETKGTFSTAWLAHGKAPCNQQYEYFILVQPTEKEAKETNRNFPYKVLQCDDTAHVVYDCATQITAYACFEEYKNPAPSSLVSHIGRETLVMHRHQHTGNGLKISVCDPDLNISEKAFTTKEPSRPIEKTLVLKGDWQLSEAHSQVTVENENGQTQVTVLCQHGQPVEFLIHPI